MQRRCQFDLLQYRGCPLGIIGGKVERLRGANTFKWYILAVVFSARCCPPFTYSECKQNSVAQLCLHSCSLLACHLLSPSIMSEAERSGAAMKLIIVWCCSSVLLYRAVRPGVNWTELSQTNYDRVWGYWCIQSVCSSIRKLSDTVPVEYYGPAALSRSPELARCSTAGIGGLSESP